MTNFLRGTALGLTLAIIVNYIFITNTSVINGLLLIIFLLLSLVMKPQTQKSEIHVPKETK